MISKWPFIWGAVGALLWVVAINPSGNDWRSMSDFSIPWSNAFIGSSIVGGAIFVYFLVMLIVVGGYLWANKLKAFLIFIIFAVWIYFWAVLVEERGQSIISNATPFYCVMVIGFCMALATMMAIKTDSEK